jgi:amino acid adenylation domain-containing protein
MSGARMSERDILAAFRAGELSASEALKEIRAQADQFSVGELSQSQRGLWALQKMAPSMSAYNVPVCFRVRGRLDFEAFKQACLLVIERNPVLADAIVEQDGIPRRVPKPLEPFCREEDISTLDDHEIPAFVKLKVKEPFVLERAPLMRVHVLRRPAGETIILIIVHHVAFDAGSVVPFLTQLLEAYRAVQQGGTLAQAGKSTGYDKFVAWERRLLTSPESAQHLDYLKRHLAGASPVLNLPRDRPQTGPFSFAGATHVEQIPDDLKRRVIAFCRAARITPVSLFLGIYKLLLSRYGGQEDIVVGLSIGLRPRAEFESVIGYFANMVPVRTRAAGSLTWSEFARGLQAAIAGAMEHSVYPFAALVRELKATRSPGSQPIFQVAFTYQTHLSIGALSALQEEKTADTLSLERVEDVQQDGEYELELEIDQSESGTQAKIKYNPDLFHQATIARMGKQLLLLLEQVIDNPAARLGDYSLLAEEERHSILIDWNSTQADYPRDVGVHELFERQAQQVPDALAVTCDGRSLTYRELDERSSLLAAYLSRHGVRPDVLVGIYVERSLEMIVGLLGILKAGGAYVPLDPEYPPERLRYLIEDSGVALIVTQTKLIDQLQGLVEATVATVPLDGRWHDIESEAHGAPWDRPAVKGENLAYVIYTSGSTGNPKGVMIPHRGLTNVLFSLTRIPGLSAKDRLLAVTTYCFDIAGFELFGPLIVGAHCIIGGAGLSRDPQRFKDEIDRVRPTIMQSTPAVWTMLYQSGWRNEDRIRILCGGEALTDALKEEFLESGCEAWNLFGPTETTIWSTRLQIKRHEPITIGRPLENTRIYIVDENLKPMPIGVPGELCIAGDGLARGYHGKAALTAERFVDNPFEPGARLYRTGDVARWLADGNIEFLGRRDDQVKLRGYRVELGEIESHLANHPAVKSCAVALAALKEHRQLHAFYVRKHHGSAADARELRDFLKSKLPSYMVPSEFRELDDIPLTPNGKIDRKTLAQMPLDTPSGAASSLPETEIEKQVLDIWKRSLGKEQIGVNEGFFDVGGDSVLAVTVAERIRTLRSDFDVTALFRHSSVRGISRHIAEARTTKTLPAVPEDLRPKPSTGAAQRCPDYYGPSIAIIGISCNFPGAEDQYKFWDNLTGGKESRERLSELDMRRLGVPEWIIRDPRYIPVRATIADKQLFDPAFFRILPKDAELMDPQLRHLLMHAWKAIEDAGYVPRELQDAGVFMSASSNHYGRNGAQESVDNTNVLADFSSYQSWLLSQSGTIPTIVSYKLGLHGPSYFIHSNCSSSLVALHVACQSIIRGETTQALVGAATLLPHDSAGYLHQEGLNLSSSGSIRAFDASADGMIGGEGVAVILVKRALDAFRDGDHVYAIIRGTSVNNDGADKAGFYAPSVDGQARVISKALEVSGVDADSICYVEAHGTGTALGDPIEFAGLREAFGKHSGKQPFCGLGSVKCNIGHLDTVAGLAGVIKVALALEREEIPQSINFDQINPKIALHNSPFYIVEQNRRLERSTYPHRAAVSSFGIGGTNAHAILERATALESREEDDERADRNSRRYLVPLSARNEERLREYAASLLQFVSERANAQRQACSLADLSYTLQVGREAMDSRLGLIVGSMAELQEKLQRFVAGEEKIDDLYRGQMQREEALAPFADDEDFQETVTKWLERGKHEKVLQLWVKGLSFDWGTLYRAAKPQRASLPTYPFAKERYWAPQNAARAKAAVRSNGNCMRPSPPQSERAAQPASPSSNLPSTIASLKRYASRPVPEAVTSWLDHSLEMDDVLLRLLFTQLGASRFPATKATVAQIKAALGVQDFYERWLEESLGALAARGCLQQDGAFYSVIAGAVPDAAAVWQEWHAQKSKRLAVPSLAALASLVERTLESLRDILSGAVRATEVLFPNGSVALVEEIYKDNPVSVYFNETLAEMAARFVEQRLRMDASARIRILEVGAGTGATTARVLSQLTPYRDHLEEYCYTDVSQAFLKHGEEAYRRDNSYLRACVLDVEKPFSRQGLRTESYDLVIAANVLHATRDIRRTVRNVKAALRRNGLLLLNEIAGKNLCMHLSLALLEGWWLYRDAALRIPGCPGLFPDTWRRLLETEGFPSVFFPTKSAHDLGLQVIVAESDGVARDRPHRTTARQTTSSATPPTRTKPANGPTDQLVTGRNDKNPPNAASFSGRTDETSLQDTVENMLIGMAAAASRLSPKDIDRTAELSAMGFDSILVMQLGSEIKQSFGVALTLTAFSQFPTLKSLAAHLVSDHAQALSERLSTHEPAAAPDGTASPSKVPANRTPNTPRSRLAKARSLPSNGGSELRPHREAGFRSVILPGTEAVPAALYYPSRSPECALRIGGFSLSVAMNGTPAETAEGLILLSHGGSGAEVSHHNLARHLARKGFLVAAPQHPGDNWMDSSLANSVRSLFQRPRQLTAALDAILADPEWKERIPAGAVGAIGHSMGACTVLSILGARVNRKGLLRHWENMAGGPWAPDKPLADWLAEAHEFGQADVADERVRAAVLLAPYCNVFNVSSLSAIKAPLRIYIAEKDALLDNKRHGIWLRRRVPNAELAEIKNAGHFAFTAVTDQAFRNDDAGASRDGGFVAIALMACEDPPNFDRGRFHQRVDAEVAEFFSRHLISERRAEHGAGSRPSGPMEAGK